MNRGPKALDWGKGGLVSCLTCVGFAPLPLNFSSRPYYYPTTPTTSAGMSVLPAPAVAHKLADGIASG